MIGNTFGTARRSMRLKQSFEERRHFYGSENAINGVKMIHPMPFGYEVKWCLERIMMMKLGLVKVKWKLGSFLPTEK